MADKKEKDKKGKKGGNKKPQQQPTPATNYQMPNFGNIGSAVGNMATQALPAGNTQLDQALAAPMPDISALLAQSGKQDMEQKSALLNSGLIRGLRRDSYGDVQTGSANPWKNGTFGTQQQQIDRANAGYEQRMREMARPAGQYNIPKPIPTQSPADFVPRGGAMGVQNLQNNWNEGNRGMLGQPQTQDQIMAGIERAHPGLANIRSMPEVATTTPTVPSPTALIDANYAVNRVPTPEELAMVNNDPQVLKAMAQQKTGQEMLAQNAKDSAYWTGVQKDMNNQLRNLVEINNLSEKPISGLEAASGYMNPDEQRRQKLEADMYGLNLNEPQYTMPTPQGDQSQINPWAPTQAGAIPQAGQRLGEFGGKVADIATSGASQLLNYLMGTNVEGTNFQQEGLYPPMNAAPPAVTPQFQGIPRSGIRPDNRNFTSFPAFPEPSFFPPSSVLPKPSYTPTGDPSIDALLSKIVRPQM